MFRNYVRFLTTTIARNNSNPQAQYVQGQYRGNEADERKRIREYFYYIDHQGMLFLDDSKMKNFTSCFKEVKFLRFFLSRLQENTTGSYESDFPYLSLCGRERNYIRCDDVPVVFTHLVKGKGTGDEAEDLYSLTWGWAGDSFTVPFQPEKLYMDVENGRVYHPGDGKKSVTNVGLIRDKIAIEISQGFVFDKTGKEPEYFLWKGKEHKMVNDLVKKCVKEKRKST